jgi:hypothetical protein
MTISKSETTLNAQIRVLISSKPHQSQYNQNNNQKLNQRMNGSQSETALIKPHQNNPEPYHHTSFFENSKKIYDYASSKYTDQEYSGQQESGRYPGQLYPGEEYPGQKYSGQQYNQNTKNDENILEKNDVRNNIYYQLSNTTDISLSSTMIAGYIINRCLPYQALCCPKAIEKLKDLRLKIIRNKYEKFMGNIIEDLKMKVNYVYMYAYIDVYVYMYVYICVYVCIYTYLFT